jgi:hypothetical protein
LNSSPSQCAVSGYIVLHPSPHVMEHIGIPKFLSKNELHRRLAELSEDCHSAVEDNDEMRLRSLESEIDDCAAKVWSITNDELKAIQAASANSLQIQLSEHDEGDE